MTLYPETPPLCSGVLPEQDGHAVFWETFGNPKAPAILLLHGGPGSGVSPRMPRLFDPDHWHIVAMDQRGAGRSAPHAGDSLAALHANTTDHLIADIERLRATLKVDAWTVYGASWGATLAQAYAHAHAARVTAMLLASVTSTSRFEIDNLYGGAGAYLPEAFDGFCAEIPWAQDGVARAAAYHHQLTTTDPEDAARAAHAWCRWEAAVLEVDPRAEPSEAFDDPRFALGFARVVTHYFSNLAWLSPPLLEKATALAHIPAILINSRMDLSCPLSTVWALHKAWPQSELIVIDGSLHGTLYGPLSEAIVRAGQRLSARKPA